MNAPVDLDLPEGFEPLPVGGQYMVVNGPLYVRRSGSFALGLRVQPRHANPMGQLHGGMMASFCDMLLPLSVHAAHEPLRNRFFPTISLQVDYLAPAPVGCWIEGSGMLLRSTRTLMFAQGLVTADGQPCARASGVFKLGAELPESFRG